MLYGHLAVSLVAGCVAILRKPGEEPTDEPGTGEGRRWEFVAAGIVGMTAAAAWGEGLWTRMSDLFYHVAGVQALLVANRPIVTDPMFGIKASVDPTSGTMHTFMALAAKLGGVGAFRAFAWLEGIIVAAYFLAFFAFARRMLGSAAQACLALVLVAGIVWSLDLRVMVYPKWFDPAIYWICLLFLLVFIKTGEARALIFAAFFAATVVLVHLGTSELLVLTVVAASAWGVILFRTLEDRRTEGLRWLLGTGACLAAMAPILYKRSVSVLGGARTSVFNPVPGDPMSKLPVTRLPGGLAVVRGGEWFQGGDWMLVFLVLGVLLAAAHVARRGGRPEIVLLMGMASIMPAAMLNLVATKYLVARYWFHLRRMASLLRFVPTLMLPYVYVVLREELNELKTDSRRRLTAAMVGAAALVNVAGLIGFGSAFARELPDRFEAGNVRSLAYSRQGNVVAGTAGLRRYLSRHVASGDVVAAPHDVSYYLVALLPVRVIAVPRSHMPLAAEVRGGKARRADQKAIFDPGVPADATSRLLTKHGTRYLVAPVGTPAMAKFLGMRGLASVYVDNGFVLFRVSE